MGYTTNGTGWIDIDPPVPASVMADVDTGCLACPVMELRADRDDGSYLVMPVVYRIQPGSEDDWRAYGVEDDLDRILDHLIKVRPDVTYRGYIWGEGEEQGDVWRISIDDDTVVFERATIRWPDGTIVTDSEREGRYPW